MRDLQGDVAIKLSGYASNLSSVDISVTSTWVDEFRDLIKVE